MKKNNTIVNFILDKSGSMESVREATISGFNEYISTLKKDTKSKYEFTLTLFDTVVIQPIIGVSIGKVEDLGRMTYRPDGNTALYDAVCKTIKEVKEKKGQKVITIIMTDGMENASIEYNQTQMKTLIEERTKKGNWTFVYLGANQDSYVMAKHYGISAQNASNFNATTRGMAATMGTVASNTAFFAQSAGTSTTDFFSKSDQDTLGNTK